MISWIWLNEASRDPRGKHCLWLAYPDVKWFRFIIFLPVGEEKKTLGFFDTKNSSITNRDMMSLGPRIWLNHQASVELQPKWAAVHGYDGNDTSLIPYVSGQQETSGFFKMPQQKKPNKIALEGSWYDTSPDNVKLDTNPWQTSIDLLLVCSPRRIWLFDGPVAFCFGWEMHVRA